jgi:hypothetical protein
MFKCIKITRVCVHRRARARFLKSKLDVMNLQTDIDEKARILLGSAADRVNKIRTSREEDANAIAFSPPEVQFGPPEIDPNEITLETVIGQVTHDEENSQSELLLHRAHLQQFTEAPVDKKQLP